MTARAPGRVNLIGDHTDYNGGLCLPFAVPLATTTTARTRGDDRLRIRSDGVPRRLDGSAGRPHPRRPRGDPGLGAVRHRRALGGARGRLAAARSRPGRRRASSRSGPGCRARPPSSARSRSPSAAWSTGPLDPGSRQSLAELCRRAETEYVGAPTGGMDQLVSLLGKPDHALLIDFADIQRAAGPAGAPRGRARRARHRHRYGARAGRRRRAATPQRRAECDAAAAALGLPRIGLAWPDDLSRLDDDVQRARARHVLSESARVEDTLAADRRRRTGRPSAPSSRPRTRRSRATSPPRRPRSTWPSSPRSTRARSVRG